MNAENRKILVIGGGISGLTAALEAAEAGSQVIITEKAPYLGGRVAQLHRYFPKLCPPTCGLENSVPPDQGKPQRQFLHHGGSHPDQRLCR